MSANVAALKGKQPDEEPISGWRCWFVLPHEGLLRPIYRRGLAWPPGRAQEAICPDEPHEAPADGCKCGLYAVCHPMLLGEIHWDTAPPKNIPKLPGVLVVGQVAQWGKVIQHERGWRAQYAYPTHLYVFTDEAAIAERLRARYKVPVAWGADAERLRRMLPPPVPEEPEQEEPPLEFPQCLWTVTNYDTWPKALQDTVCEMLRNAADEYWRRKAPSTSQPGARIVEAQKGIKSASDRWARRAARRDLALAAADRQAAVCRDILAARRALWVRPVRWRRAVLAHMEGPA
jgi:hypothetical protein